MLKVNGLVGWDDSVLNQVRALAQSELGEREIEDYQWDGLVKQRIPLPDIDMMRVDEREAVLSAVRETVKAWLDLYGSVPPGVGRPKTRPPHGPAVSRLAELRQDAMTALYAADARADEEVLAFRNNELGGKLLPGGDQVDTSCREWILGFDGGWACLAILMSARFPADERDDGKSRYDWPETLRSLHKLSDRLARRYDWIKGAATQFVLADQVPRVYPLRASGRIPYSWISASRITLVLDPATSPEEVADFYQRVRKSDSYYAGAQVRPLSAKALMLAEFSATAYDAERAIDQVKRWNEQHPEHAYDHSSPASVSNFRRDLKQARARLLYPRLGLAADRGARNNTT